MKLAQNKLTKLLFGLYLLAIGWILLLKLGVRFSYMAKREFNFLPFREAVLFNGKIDYTEIIMNIIIFIPLGIYISILFKKLGIFGKFFSIFFLSLSVECLQYVFRLGSFDITDIITNSFGGTIGLVIYFIISKVLNNNQKTQKFINVFATLGTITMLLFLFLLKTNRLGIRYQ